MVSLFLFSGDKRADQRGRANCRQRKMFHILPPATPFPFGILIPLNKPPQRVPREPTRQVGRNDMLAKNAAPPRKTTSQSRNFTRHIVGWGSPKAKRKLPNGSFLFILNPTDSSQFSFSSQQVLWLLPLRPNCGLHMSQRNPNGQSSIDCDIK